MLRFVLKKYYIIVFLTVLALMIAMIILGLFLDWHEYTIIAAELATFLVCIFIYWSIYLLVMKKLAIVHQNKRWEEVIRQATKIFSWYRGGRNDSMYHSVILAARFSLKQDEEFLADSNAIVMPRYAEKKHFWRTVYFVIKNQEKDATAELALFQTAIHGNEYQQRQRILTRLMEFIHEENPEKKKEIANELKKEFDNERVNTFLDVA